jgi:hypothetical protein
MDEENIKEDEVESYLTTYQWVTVGQLLEGYGLKLSDTSVLLMLRKKTAFYFQLLRIPVMNVLNGIIIDQTKAYRIYVQKMFVEYLVSGQADVEETIGSETRAALEKARVHMLEIGSLFDESIKAHEALIIETQRTLIQWSKQFKATLTTIGKAWMSEIHQQTGLTLSITMPMLYDLFVDADGFEASDAAWKRFESHYKQPFPSTLKNTLQTQFKQLNALQDQFKAFIAAHEDPVLQLQISLNQHRSQFYDEIIQVQNLLMLLPGFDLNPVYNTQERASLNFDTHIGEKS